MMSSDIFAVRGIVLCPEDLSWDGWVPALAEAGINQCDLHGSVDDIINYLQSPVGQQFLRRLAAVSINLNFQLHIMHQLLPSALFQQHPAFFRMDEQGQRLADGNPCVSCADGLAVICGNAVRYAHRLQEFSQIDRFYFWPADGGKWCCCPQCRDLSASDQYLRLVNAMIAALREAIPTACVPYLAYLHTLTPPTAITPADGVFLQYAPIERCYTHALDDEECPENRRHTELFAANLAHFAKADAEVLEYWLDASFFSRWRKPSVELPFSAERLAADLAVYASHGIQRVSTFGVYLDAAYVKQYGVPPISEYGEAIRHCAEVYAGAPK